MPYNAAELVNVRPTILAQGGRAARELGAVEAECGGWWAVEETGDPSGDLGVAGSGGGEGPPYLHLAVRAADFVRHRGGAAAEDALISHVFGGSASATLWRPLLRQVLGGGDDLVLRADGCWSLAGAAPATGERWLDDFVVLDVETTGLQPSRQRVIEVAAIRFRGGEETSRFESLCRPNRRVPKYVVDLTKITDELLAEAPSFAEIVDGLLGQIGETLVVGHNVGFDLAFLDAELRRLERPTLINERVDTLGLALRLLPGLRKPSLGAVAQELGVLDARHRGHRAAADAQLTGRVALQLEGRARAQGVASLERFRALASPVPAKPRHAKGRTRTALDRSLLAEIPKAPGVYLMRDAFDRVIYVGKAKNLRDRVGSYFGQPLGLTRKMDGLLESLARVEVEVVGSELEALLLESQLIKRYQPRYNTALRAFEHYPFIRVDVSNAWPRVTLAKARKEDGARYFGPFRSTAGARKTVEVLNRVLPLRTCTRSFRDARSYGSPCLELDLGRCLGPCVGKADREEYAALVRDVTTFLDGRDEVLYERLWQGLEEAAERLDFERAARLRKDLQRVHGVVAAQRRLREATEAARLLVVLPSAEPGAREVLLVAEGRPWAQIRGSAAEGAGPLADRLARAWERLERQGLGPVGHETVDTVNILGRWLREHEGHPGIMPLGEAMPDWDSVAASVLSFGVEQLDYDVRRGEPEDDGEGETEGAASRGTGGS